MAISMIALAEKSCVTDGLNTAGSEQIREGDADSRATLRGIPEQNHWHSPFHWDQQLLLGEE